ncbi:hypothetical protein LEMLEM_LOCUS16392 [Lemmus lemmus]
MLSNILALHGIHVQKIMVWAPSEVVLSASALERPLIKTLVKYLQGLRRRDSVLEASHWKVTQATIVSTTYISRDIYSKTSGTLAKYCSAVVVVLPSFHILVLLPPSLLKNK